MQQGHETIDVGGQEVKGRQLKWVTEMPLGEISRELSDEFNQT